jgi:hypothetical protein
MAGDPEDDDVAWFKPVWEIEDEEALEPPGPLRHVRKPAAAPDYHHPLLAPLAKAQDAVARLEARVEAASEAVAEGLRARMSYLEAAGWLRHAYVGIHPRDLALRDHGITASYWAAAAGGRLATVLPSTAVESEVDDMVPFAPGLELTAGQALRVARQWRRLSELRSWRPLTDTATVRETVESLGSRSPEDAEIGEWLAWVHMQQQGPPLIRAGRAALEWMCLPGMKDRDPASFFLAACLWREKSARPPIISLPFWSAPELRHHRLGLRFGVDWMAEYLECVTAAAMVGLQELARLQEAEAKGRHLGATARSRLPDALDAVLRAPIATTGSLAKALRVTPRAALGLLQQLMAAGILREATGRASWRAFVLSVH